MDRQPDTTSEKREFWQSTSRPVDTKDRVKEDFEHRSADAVRQALGNRACQL
jgi:hypothetical protein